MGIELVPTGRGFLKGNFKDRYGEDCSIQESSLASEDCIWLGCDLLTEPSTLKPVGARMHLTRAMVEDLLPLLKHFAETGRLPASST